jgi:hypothetical protein
MSSSLINKESSESSQAFSQIFLALEDNQKSLKLSPKLTK